MFSDVISNTYSSTVSPYLWTSASPNIPHSSSSFYSLLDIIIIMKWLPHGIYTPFLPLPPLLLPSSYSISLSSFTPLHSFFFYFSFFLSSFQPLNRHTLTYHAYLWRRYRPVQWEFEMIYHLYFICKTTEISVYQWIS